MGFIGQLIYWIVLGAIVGWVVSLILGIDFKAGCLGYIIVGIITMIVLGLLIKLFWALLLIALALVAGSWLLKALQRGRF